MKSQKKFIGLLLFLLLASGAAGHYAFDYFQTEKRAQEAETVAVARGTIEDIVTAQGTLGPRDYVDVGAQVSGQLKKLYVDYGSVVKKGDLLAEIDPQTYQSRLEGDVAKVNSLSAQLEQQKAQAGFDGLQYERAQKLIKTRATSQQDLEDKDKTLKISEATVKSLEAQIAEAQANVDTDKINLGYTKIYAPMDGIVSDKKAQEGQTLNANQTTPTIVQIANLDVMTVSAQVAEADVSRLKPGMESEFVTLGSADRKWKGAIRQILPTPEVVNDVVLYDVLIDIENKDGQLMNKMSTQNSFIVGRAENALLLPARALGRHIPEHDSDEKGQAYIVRVLGKNGAIEEREIYVGLLTRAKAEIKSGLAEGDKIVVAGETAPAAPKNAGGPRMPGMGRI